MSDFISFNEGRKQIWDSGRPATTYFLLSTKAVADFLAADTLAGGVGEITGTGYARQSEATPAATAANPAAVAYAQKSWATDAATDWPASVKSCVAVTSPDNTGKALGAWNLVPGGAARDMSAANTTENFTPTLDLS